ncbi:MAG: translocation/assembly module TamB [Muribaculum sp.]|nr:translocation/assembly module TamB [Muribaculum sp.]
MDSQDKNTVKDGMQPPTPDNPAGAPTKHHKWLRRIGKTILCIIAVIIILPILLYIPPVQDFLVRTASGIVADKTGMKIGIERFRLKFPLDISLKDVAIIEATGDTMVLAKEVIADVKLLPLLHLDAQINELKLVDAYYRMLSPDSSMLMTINAGLLRIDDKSSANLSTSTIDLNDAYLKDGIISLAMDPSKTAEKDTSESSTPFLLKAKKLSLDNIKFVMSMPPTIDTLLFTSRQVSLANGIIDLGKNRISIDSISATTGLAQMLSPDLQQNGAAVSEPQQEANGSEARSRSVPESSLSGENVAAPAAPPMIIEIGKVSLAGYEARYAVQGAPAAAGFNPSDIRASNLSITLENFRNAGTDISLPISTLSGSLLLSESLPKKNNSKFKIQNSKFSQFKIQNSKFKILQLLPESHGVFSMDSAGMMLKDFLIKTPNSRIAATAAIPNALMEMLPSALLDVDVDASIGVSDINAFMPDLKAYTSVIPASSPVNAKILASGSLGDADISAFDVKIPGVISLRASGKAKNLVATKARSRSVPEGSPSGIKASAGVIDLKNLIANLKFEGELQKPSVIKNFVEAPGINIPQLSVKGNASVSGENYAADFTLATPLGSVVGNGKVGMNSERYEANVNVRNLNVGAFMGDTIMGPLTATLYATGAGFNPEKKNAHTDIKLNLDNFIYNHQSLKNIDLEATLQNGAFTIDANSFSTPLNFNIAGRGTIGEDFYQADLVADIRNLDLMALGLSPTASNGTGRVRITGNAAPRTWNYDVTLTADNIDWHLPDQDLILPRGATLRLNADADHTQCDLDARGTSVSFLAASGLQNLIIAFSDVSAQIPKMMDEKRVDVAGIESKLPPFTLKADVDGKGIVNEFLGSSGMQFGTFNLDLKKDSLLQGNMLLMSLRSGTTQLDTITLGLKSRGQLIDYQVHLGNRPGVMDEFADVNLSGYLGDNRLSAYLVQHNIKKKMGYRVGFTASLADSIVSLRFTPLKATIAYLPWRFNLDNYIDVDFEKKRINANLEASSDQSSILLRSEDTADGGESLHLNLKNIRVQDFLQMSLNAPPLTANVNSDINVSYNGKALIGKGSLDVSDLVYDRKQVGDLSLTLAAGMGNKGRSGGKIGFLVNEKEAAAIQFLLAPDTINPGGSMIAERLTLELTKFPLSIANAFMPTNTMSLSGSLNGNMAMSGTFTAPLLNGSISSDSIGVYVNMLGTTLRLGSEPIVVADNVLKFDNFNISAVNDNPLYINGTVDASKFTNILLDLNANAKNMQLVGGKKSKGDITGDLFVDLNADVTGPMSRMNIDAMLDILPTTDVTYNLMMGGSDMLSGQSGTDDVVRFVNFADSTLVAQKDSLSSSLSMRITAKATISQGAQVAVNITGDIVTGGGKIECNPSGTLNYFQNYMGDMRLNGTLYTGTGYANYSIPVVGRKSFEFDRDSHITWNGDILNPMLDIKASDEMKTNVQMNGNTSLVNFIVSLNIGNTLSAPSVVFDLSTNDDMSISNELQSMTAEQRQQQAMNLLITGSYTGPGAKSVKGNMVTGQLYSFLTSRLNAFAANNIKGVDINFGVDQYEQGTNGNTSTTTSYSYQVSKSLINNRFKILVGGNYSTDASADENFQQNLISDIAFEYILKQTNNMSLNAKLFRHTGFESILEGEITETGVGLNLRRRLAYFTEITHFGLSKLWKKPKKVEVPAPNDSIQAPDDLKDLKDSKDPNDPNPQNPSDDDK